MKTDFITAVILVFCAGVFASALAASDLFSAESSAAVTAQARD